MQPITLSQLGLMIRDAINTNLPDEYWVRAEISSLRRSGHCYLELVEKDEKSNALLAKVNATIWRNVFALIDPYFTRETGMELGAGIKVLLCVKPQYHELYGMSLNVLDIDPAYTIGDLEQNRQQILNELRRQGIIDLNRELELPRPALRIAIVSSPSAAGYGDFMNQLQMSPWNFSTALFEATMQGVNVESSIIEALDAIAEEADRWDCVVIIRGGGATSDLHGFDSLMLAEHVAQFPLPVITGLGHERDNTVLDLISHTRCKTPTAAAEFLVNLVDEEAALLDSLSQSITASVTERIAQESERLSRIESALPQLFRNVYIEVKNQLERIDLIIRMSTLHRMESETHKLQMIEKSIESVNPQHILKRGYTITLSGGKVVRSAADIKAGDVVTTRFTDGSRQMKVVGDNENK